MNQLPYDLFFCHRFNLHKLVGLLIEDDDLESIARIYGVAIEELRDCQTRLDGMVAEAAEEITKQLHYTPSEEPCRYLALGDSITSDRSSYGKIIKNLWSETPKRQVIDAGISGDTVSDLMDRFYTDVLNQEFDWISIFIGTNDSRGLKDSYGMHYTSVDEYKKCLHYFVKRLLEKTNNIILITIPPADNTRISQFFGEESNWVYSPDYIGEINEIIRTTAKENGVHLADLASAIEKEGFDPLSNDGLHMNPEGHKLLTKLLLEILP